METKRKIQAGAAAVILNGMAALMGVYSGEASASTCQQMVGVYGQYYVLHESSRLVSDDPAGMYGSQNTPLLSRDMPGAVLRVRIQHLIPGKDVD
jgi:hypothetical protein